MVVMPHPESERVSGNEMFVSYALVFLLVAARGYFPVSLGLSFFVWRAIVICITYPMPGVILTTPYSAM